MLSDVNRKWLAEFRARYGRPPRVLHIGNIANNAYNNAKILREAGIDCDVICHDYYHSMGCPEWEDVEFDGQIPDQFRPDWSSLDLKGYQRPKWFVQGHVTDCIDFLITTRNGRTEQAGAYWRRISYENRTLPRPKAVYVRMGIRVFLRQFRNLIYQLCKHENIATFLEWRIGRGNAQTGDFRDLPVIFLVALGTFCAFVLRIFFIPWKKFVGKDEFEKMADLLAADFEERFPQRADKLSSRELSIYRQMNSKWKELCQGYDAILAYSTSTVYPMLAGIRYFAFEHGTLRAIPYENSTQGRCTALGYSRAEHVFVTNFDCVDSASRLAPKRFTLINHPYDEDRGLNIGKSEPLRESLQKELDSDVIFFFPTRHDWVADSGYADKGNDIFLLALAELRRQSFSVGVVCCDWGADVQHSKRLCERQGIARHVKWLQPMGIVKFERMAVACDIVVDQFYIGAFGGVMFKAMSVGAPVLTFLDETRVLQQYSELPPIINCKTEFDIVDNISALLGSPGSLDELSRKSRAWIKKHHSKWSTINLQIDQFRRVMTPSNAGAEVLGLCEQIA